ncbi:MAG: ribosome maturation factor RimP [Gammaproteobacteria bacterium]|nr:ribosome maturation factor RimP [Gammaproteobacteria bacterium]
MKVEAQLNDRLASLIIAMDYEFVGSELRREGRDLLLRIYIDKVGGVTVDDCTKVSRQVSAMLDVEDPFMGRYSLEVSSPGINRPLFTLAQYERYLGSQVKLRLSHPLNGRMNFVGQLIRVEEVNVCLLMDAEEVSIPFADIARANIVTNIVPGKLN